MEIKIAPDPMTNCHGWAYEQCGDRAIFVMTELWANGSWSALPLCIHHARTAIENRHIENHPAAAYTWMEAAAWRAEHM